MLLASTTLIRMRLPFALILCAICLWPPVVARAQDKVTVNFVVTVTDEQEKPIKGAQINLPRAGTNAAGHNLYPIPNKPTDEAGRYEKSGTDFDLAANPRLELTVTADGFQQQKVTIEAEEVRRAATAPGQLLEIPVQLKPGNPSPSPQQGSGAGNNSNANAANVTGSAVNRNANQAGTPTPAPDERGYFQRAGNAVKDAVNYVIWWLGILLLAQMFLLFVAWKLGYGLPFQRRREDSGPPHPSRDGGKVEVEMQAEIMPSLISINKVLAEISRKQNESYMLLDKVFLKINQDAPNDARTPPKKEREVTPGEAKFRQGNESTTGQRQAGASHPTRQAEGSFQQLNASSPQVSAVKAYHNLLRGMTSATEPVYLNAENKSSLTDMLEDGPVHLTEVGHTQGTFVLFASGEQSGWIFPNPVLTFREQALKPVFPSLTEGDFNSFKERIDPMPAHKIAEGRWKLEAR